MIAKIKSGNKFYGAARYNQKKVDAGQAKVLFQAGFVNTKPQTVADTLHYMSGTKVKKPVFHVSLSFAAEDRSKLDDERMVEISKAYMKRMGYGDQPMVIYRHFDTEHPHVHILTTRVDVHTGRKIKDHFEGRKSKEITDMLEIKHGLVISDKRKLVSKEIVEEVGKVLQNHKPENIDFLNKALHKEGATIRVQPAGKGLIYYKVDGEGKRNSQSWKASAFRDFGLDMTQLKDTFQANRADRIHVRDSVQKMLENNTPMTVKQFTERLNARQIDPIFREGSKGYLGVNYGYKDHTYKGSELDRKLGWSNIKKYLDLPDRDDYLLKKHLLESARSGKSVVMDYENRRVTFKSSVPALDEQLAQMPQLEAIEIAKTHNRRIAEKHDPGHTPRPANPDVGQDKKEDLSQGVIQGNKLRHLENIIYALGDDVDEFLRKRKRNKHGKGQKIAR